jgi:hypothetical protein
MHTIRRKLTPPRIAATGGNACESGLSGDTHLRQAISRGLTRPILLPNAPESENTTFTVGSRTLAHFLLPSRDPRNVLASSARTTRTSLGNWQFSSSEERGCLARSFPVCLVYSSRAALNTSSEVGEEAEGVFREINIWRAWDISSRRDGNRSRGKEEPDACNGPFIVKRTVLVVAQVSSTIVIPFTGIWNASTGVTLPRHFQIAAAQHGDECPVCCPSPPRNLSSCITILGFRNTGSR